MNTLKRFRTRQRVVLSDEGAEKLIEAPGTTGRVVRQDDQLVTVKIPGRTRADEYHEDFWRPVAGAGR